MEYARNAVLSQILMAHILEQAADVILVIHGVQKYIPTNVIAAIRQEVIKDPLVLYVQHYHQQEL